MTQEYDLPPLPEHDGMIDDKWYGWCREPMQSYARLAIEPYAKRIAELERLCEETYVAQGADAYNIACTEMEHWQEQRHAAGKTVGTTGSLCDGIQWLYKHIEKIETQIEADRQRRGEPVELPTGWREQFKEAVYDNLAAADNQDVPLEEYPDRILKVLDSIVGPRHPTVVAWRNDAIRACMSIAYKYCRDTESHRHLKQDLEALITAVPQPDGPARAWRVGTDEQIRAIAIADGGLCQDDQTAEWSGSDKSLLQFARAVLDRFGQPAMTADEWLKQHEALMHRATKAALVAGYSGRGEAALDKAEYALLDHARRRIEGKT